MTSPQLAENLRIIEQKVLDACAKADRDRKSVKILLATKTVPAATVLHAFQLGYTLVGENKVQEFKIKYDELPNTPLEWHFIGHLQSNKAKDVVGKCALIHSLDRLSLAQELDRRGAQNNQTVDVLLEVNTSREATKSGLPPDQTLGFCKALASFKHLRIKGLMTMAIPSPEEEKVRACFRQLREVSQNIAKLDMPHCQMEELSMGMSQDFELAIQEGATLIRLGSAVFGSR